MFPPPPFRVYIHLGAAGGNNMLPIHRRREGPLPPSLPPSLPPASRRGESSRRRPSEISRGRRAPFSRDRDNRRAVSVGHK